MCDQRLRKPGARLCGPLPPPERACLACCCMLPKKQTDSQEALPTASLPTFAIQWPVGGGADGDVVAEAVAVCGTLRAVKRPSRRTGQSSPDSLAAAAHNSMKTEIATMQRLERYVRPSNPVRANAYWCPACRGRQLQSRNAETPRGWDHVVKLTGVLDGCCGFEVMFSSRPAYARVYIHACTHAFH
jgi:hypothetical protein